MYNIQTLEMSILDLFQLASFPAVLLVKIWIYADTECPSNCSHLLIPTKLGLPRKLGAPYELGIWFQPSILLELGVPSKLGRLCRRRLLRRFIALCSN